MSSSQASSVDPVAPPEPRVWRTFSPPLAPLWVWLGCIAVALLVNAGALPGRDFIWTDRPLVSDNSLLNRLAGLQAMWFGGIASPSTYALPQYSPLTQTTFFIDRVIWGDRLAGYRITSILLHATAGLMLWQLLRGLAVRGALAITLLFIAHPTTVETTAWLTERRNALGALLGLAAMFLLLRAARVIAAPAGKFKALPDDPARLYAMGAALYVLGLFAHAALLAPLPLMMLLVVWWKHLKPSTALAGTAVALTVAAMAMVALTSTIEKNRSGVVSATAWNRASTTAGELAVRTQIAGRAVVFYAQKLAFPFPLSVEYPRWLTQRDVESIRTYARPVQVAAPTTEPATAPAPLRPFQPTADVAPGKVLAYIFPLLVVGALVASRMLVGRLGRGQFVAVGGFALLLLPFLGFIDLGWMRYAFVADRAVYLASIPFFAGVVGLMLPLFQRVADQVTAVATLAVLLGIYVVVGFSVSRRYGNEIRFWLSSANAVLDNRTWATRYGFADAMLARGAVDRNVIAAVAHVGRVRPDDPSGLVLEGLLRAQMGQPVESMRAFDEARMTFPGDAAAHFYAGEAFRLQAQLRPTDPKAWYTALALYQAAADRDPFHAQARVRIGQTDWEIARRLGPNDPSLPEIFDHAARAFDQAVQLRPYDVDQLLAISRTLIEMGKLSDATQLLVTAQSLAPRRAEVYLLVAEAARLTGNINGGDSALRQAIALDPTLTQAFVNLGQLRQAQERWDEARELYRKALENDPDNAVATQGLKDVEARAATQPAK